MIARALTAPLFAAALAGSSIAQCPQLYDYYGIPSDTPTWYSCSGSNFTLLIASPTGIGAYMIDWGDGSPLSFGASLVPPQSVSHVYPAAVAEYTVTFTEAGSGCVITGTVVMEQSTSASIQIPLGGLTQICAPQAVAFINSSTNTSPNTVFTWNFGDATAPLVFDWTNLGQTISHTYMPGTVSCETTVTLSAENNCNTLQGGPSIATFNPIRVWDIDSARISPSATLLCWPDDMVTFLNTTQRNCLFQGNIYQRFEYWNFGNYWGQGQDSIINWNPWPPTFPRTITYPAIGSYNVIMLDSNYCGVDTARVTITIVPPPSVTLSVNPDTICAGVVAFFHETTTGGANHYGWNFGDGGGWQVTGPGDQAHTYSTAGTYSVSYAASIQNASSGCTDTATVQIVVLPSPTAQFTLDQNAACISLTTDPTNTSLNAVSYVWDFGDGTTDTQWDPPPHIYPTVGDYTISLLVTNADGCTDQTSQVVHVYDPPQVVIGAQNVCVGTVAQFSDQSITAPGNPVIQWARDFGDGAIDSVQSPMHLYAGSGTFIVTLTATTPYCSNTGTQSVTVQAKPVASFTSTPVIGCSPMTVSFTNTSTGATNYLWDFGDGASVNAFSPSHTFINLGTADSIRTVTLVVSTAFGCSDTASMDITVSPAVVAMFTNDAIPGCAPINAQFTNTSTGASSYFWDLGDGTTSTVTSPSHTYTNNTFFLQSDIVTLIATSPAGCADTAQQTILVYPTANFTFVAAPDSGCSPFTLTLPQVVGAVSYQWDFGDGSTGSGPSPTHTYLDTTNTSQIYPITLIAANAFGCSDTAYSQVTVFPAPVAQFAVSNVLGCHPLLATLTNTSQGALSYSWDYGDGASSDTSVSQHTHTWYNFLGPGAATYPITLTAHSANGCSNVVSAQVQVYPLVTAAFVADTVGCSPFDPHFVNVSIGATTFLWTFGDGSGSALQNITHTYYNQGLNDVTFTPTLVATSSFGCSDTTSLNILVHPAPIAQFTPSTLAGCTPLPITFADQSVGATSMAWQFGDGAFLNGAPGDVTHTYINSATVPQFHDAQLIATSAFGCMDTVIHQIQIYPPVTALFNAPTEGCSPFTVNLADQSTGAGQSVWDMGDGTALVGANVTHTYVNNTTADQQHTIILIATSAFGCSDTLMQPITIHPMPIAGFSATPSTQQFPSATVAITNTTSAGPWNYAWDFGDGVTSTVQDPITHTYGTWGQFTITLIVSASICSDTITQQITIDPPLPTASFIGQGEGCAPLTVHFTNTSLLAQSYQWNFGDGGTSAADDPTYIYNIPGTYTVSMTATSVGGGVSTAVNVDSIIVHPRAQAYFVLQPSQVIVPSQPVFTYNLSGNATSYLWNFGDGTTSIETNPTHYYQSAGTFDVTLIANNQWNCPDTFDLPGAVTGIASGAIQFPNAFTPGNSGPGDGVYDPQSFNNDIFFPVYEGVSNYHLQVFDRWGELVFESFDVKKGWDGWYRGRPAKQDVYAWKAYARFSSGDETNLAGDVTLLR